MGRAGRRILAASRARTESSVRLGREQRRRSSMRRRAGRIVLVAVGLCVTRHADAQDPPVTPAEQYQSLLEACEIGSPGKVLSDEERIEFVGHAYKVRNEVALRFVELAE